MKKDKLMGYVEMAGETLVVTGAAAWLPLRKRCYGHHPSR